MKKIIISLLLQYLFWMVFFVFLRAVFLIFHIPLLSLEPVSAGEALMAFWHALKLDSSTAGYILVIPAILLLFQGFVKAPGLNRINKIWAFLVILAFSLIVTVELGSFAEWNSKLTAKALTHLENPSEVYFSIPAARFFMLLGILAILTALSYWIYTRFFFIPVKDKARPVIYPVLYSILIVPILFVVIRGGVNAIPISQSSAHYSHHSILNWAAVNSGYHFAVNLVESNRYKDYNAYSFYDREMAEEIVKEIKKVEKDTTVSILKTARPNIVILLMESWTADIIESLGGDAGITPQFGNLEKDGLLFTQFYCTGNRSHEAVATLFGGHPAIPYTTWPENPEKYRKMPSMVRMLNEDGYHTSFYFGGQLNYGNMRAYLLHNRFARIVEEKDIGSSVPRGRLGVHDEFLLSEHLKDASSFQQPFFSVIFTLSSHSPYDHPMDPVIDWAGVHNDFLNSAYYSDRSLGAYFDSARKEPWYDSTLFIILADHGHGSHKNWRYESYEYHRIPLLFYGNVLKEEFRGRQDDRICDNSSVVRTILKQLGLPADEFTWGQNLFNPYSKEYAYLVLNDGYAWKEDGKEIVFAMKWQQYYKMEFPDGTEHEDKMKFLRRAKSYVQVLFQEFLDK